MTEEKPMSFEHGVERTETLSLGEKRALIYNLYAEKWKGRRSFPFMPEVVGPDGYKMEKSTGAVPGSATTEKVADTDHVIRSIRTGTGYIAEGTPEMVTKELTGCLGVFVFGKMKDAKPVSALFHMTPTTSLSWGNFAREQDEKLWGKDTRKRMSGAIIEALEEVGADISSCQVILIRTAGYPPNPKRYEGYGEDHQREKELDLIANFESHGLRAKALEPLLMETATVYWTPEAPEEIYAVGEKRMTSPLGGVEEPPADQREVVSQTVSLV